MSSSQHTSGVTPRVFISYAHDSDAHRGRVLRFASFLHEQGIEAVLDTWFTGERQDWYAWAIREMTRADRVLVIASPRYRLVGDGSGSIDVHKGVQSEAALLRELVYADRARWLPRILPVILSGHQKDEIPLFLQPSTASHYRVGAFTVAESTDLLRVILRQPAHVAPPVRAETPVLTTDGSRAVWGEFDRLPARIQALLRAQEILAADMPYRLRGARQHSLGTVYVRQELGTGTDAPRPEQPRTEPYRDGKVPVSLPEPPAVRLAVRPPARPIRAALDANDHLLITGGPGQGKSTLSLRLTAEIILAWSTAPAEPDQPLAEPVVPLRLTARDLAARRGLPFERVLAECVAAEYGTLLCGEVNTDDLADRVSGCRWLLLIDGLDEVADVAERDRLVRALAARAMGPQESPYRILLTTRPIEGAALAPFQGAGAARYELQPFDESALADFAKNWFADEGPDAADRFVRQVRAAHLDELVRVPLLATIAAIMFGEHRGVPLPDNQYELYQAYLDYLRAGRSTEMMPFEEIRTPLLEHLGRVRLETDTPLLPAALDWYAQRIPAVRRPANWRDDLGTYLTAVGPLAMRGEELRFLHHSFAEHLAATSMARELPEVLTEEDEAFAHLLHAAHDEIRGRYPRTVLLHYTRLRPDEADRLVRLLHLGTPADHLLAARLLAKHAPASVGVISEFLSTARAWAMATQYPGKIILTEVARATHHSGLRAWLVKLSNDGTAPWQSRVVAASALASRPGEPHATVAAKFLETVVHDESIAVTDRLNAAEGLVDSGLEWRAAAERGLRLVLANPSTPAYQRRTAMVVLASLSPEAHAHAVGELLSTLDDPWIPQSSMIEAATALAEISLEFHGRCAEVFRSVIVRRMWSGTSGAARGLAALGPQYLNEAGAALTVFIRTRTNPAYQRGQAAETLHELGPMFSVAAGELVLDMLAEPGTSLFDRDWYLYTLARLGADHREQAAALLKEAVTNTHFRVNPPLNLFGSLIALGPGFHVDAAQALRRAVEDPLVAVSSRTSILARLAELGQAHRAYASQQLLELEQDQVLGAETRCEAARELARLGPEFHAKAAATLLDLVLHESLPSQQITFACSTLVSLNIRNHDDITRALTDVATSSHSLPGFQKTALRVLADMGIAGRKLAAETATAVLMDPRRHVMQRVVAAEALANLGDKYYRTAYEGLLDALHHDAPDLDFRSDWDEFRSMGIRPRHLLANALMTQLSHPDLGPQRKVNLADKIAKLSDEHREAAVDILRTVINDDSTEPAPRFDAATTLAELLPECVEEAASAIQRYVHRVNIFWTARTAYTAFIKIGHNSAATLLRPVLVEPNNERELRRTAAELLLDSATDVARQAIDELRSQSSDEYLDNRSRGEILMRLAEVDSSWTDHALVFHRQLLDEDHAAPLLCYAAEQVVRLDRGFWHDAVARVRRLLSSPKAGQTDRLAALNSLDQLNAISSEEKVYAARTLASDPLIKPAARRQAINLLDGTLRVNAQRLHLADDRTSIRDRTPRPRYSSQPPPLQVETEVAIRDVFTAPEASIKERVYAAAELAEISTRLMAEAVEILSAIADSDTQARFAAFSEMAWLDGPWRPAALQRVATLVTDDSLPDRVRRLAATKLIYIDYQPNPIAIDYLRAVATNEELPAQCRLDASYALRHLDGPGPIRTLRDSQRLPAVIRVEAATRLIAYTSDDRVAAADLLGQVGGDQTMRPPLRLNALNTLAKLGNPGRKQAIGVLTQILNDPAVPVTTRALAASQLVEICPRRRSQATRILREIQNAAGVMASIRVLVILGQLCPEEATSALLNIAEDSRLPPVPRLRAAEELGELRTDQRELAAVVARDFMHDEQIAWHVRRHAARVLAVLSRLCRQEARDMIRRLDSVPRTDHALPRADEGKRGEPHDELLGRHLRLGRLPRAR